MSKTIKVLHISHTDIRTDGRILKELNSLVLVNNYVIHAYGLNRGDEKRMSDINPKVKIKSFTSLSLKLRFLPRPIKFGLLFLESSIKILFNGLLLKPNIIHCHDALFLPLGFILNKLTDSKLIYDAHELESLKNGQSKVLSKATFLIEKYCWKKIDLLISVSPSIINWYSEKIGPKKSQLILNSPDFNENGLDLSKFGDNYFKNKFKIKNSSKIFLYIGILCDGRGIDLCLEVFSKYVKQHHVVFLGYGVLQNEIVNFASNNGNIHFHEAVPYSEVVKYARNADFGLCLIEPISVSDNYCLPNKLYEYIFSGLTIIGSDLPEIKSTIQDYNLGCVSKLNVEDLVNTINQAERSGIDYQRIYNLSWQYQARELTNRYLEITKTI
jgi:glycosyltransferase involved in cell wall biosynthesis